MSEIVPSDPEDLDLPLLDLFSALQKDGLPLGVGEYQGLLAALQAGFGTQDRAALKRLCQTLWASSQDDRLLVDYRFELTIPPELPSEEAEVPGTEVPPAPKPYDPKAARRPAVLVFGAVLLVTFGVGVWQNWLQRPEPLKPVGPELVKATSADETPKPTNGESPTPTQPGDTFDPLNSPADERLSRNLIVLVFVIAMVLAVVGLPVVVELRIRWWTAKQYMARLSKAQFEAPQTTPAADYSAAAQDEVEVAGAIRETAKEAHSTADSFVPSEKEYLPVTQRQMQQSLRRLRRFARVGPRTELDVAATTNRIAKTGIFLAPVFAPQRVNCSELLLLVDRRGSMVPFHLFSERLVEAIVQSGGLGRTAVYYFQNCPGRYLYRTLGYQEAERTEAVLEKMRPDRSVAVVFSDAGAARGGLSWERVERTRGFVERLQQYARRSVWLNPLPEERWLDTTAEEIAEFVPMFAADREGLARAIAMLRGC